MNIPDNLKYTQDHEWVKIEGDTAIVGITEYAQGELGDIVFIEIETEGEEIAKGDVFGTIEAVKTVSDLFMPIDGEVSEVNEALNDTPDKVNSDPYNAGWMIKMSVKDTSQLDTLLSASEYEELINA